jgi:voltage-gated potassium channel
LHPKLERSLATAVVIVALATIPLTVLLEQQTVPTWVRIADWAVWGVFVLEYFALLAIAPNRWEYIKKNGVSLAIVILSSPPLPAILDLVRLARLVRFLRLARLAGVTMRGLTGLRTILGRHGLLYVASATVLIICAGGSGLALIEPQTVRGGFADGIWWAVVTASTVGYGDIAPTTIWGRLVAVLLMLTGVGLLSTLAASITAHFLEQDSAADMREVKERIGRIENLLIEVLAERNGCEGNAAFTNARSATPFPHMQKREYVETSEEH